MINIKNINIRILSITKVEEIIFHNYYNLKILANVNFCILEVKLS